MTLCLTSIALSQSPRAELIQTIHSSTPGAAGQFGEAITVGDATDGWPMFVGSPNLPGKGRVERFINTGAQWEATNCILTQAGSQNGTGFGEALSTSGVGAAALLVIGEPYFDKAGGFTDQGRVSVFKRDAGTICYSRIATLNSPVDAANQFYGASVDVSVGASESYIIVGAPTKNEAGTGAAYIYRSTSGGATWTLDSSVASAPVVVGSGFGYDVAIDGADYVPTAAVGAFRELDAAIEQGAMYVYRRVGGSWTSDPKVTISGLYPDSTRFGWSVDVAVSSTRTFVIGSAQCHTCGNVAYNPRIVVYERLDNIRDVVTYQEDMMIISRFNIGEEIVLKNQPGDADGFFMAFTSNDYYNELWTREDQYVWNPATTSIAGTAASRIAVAASAGFAPHLAVGQASINTAWISAPSATSFELLGNGDFGQGTASNAGLAKKWQASNVTDDKRKCGGVVGCYYQFKGSANENSLLKQVVKLSNHTFSSGDTFTLSADFKTAYANPNLILMLTVTESSGVSKHSLVLDAPASDWETLIVDPYTPCTAPTKLVVTLRNKSKGGNIKVDNISLTVESDVVGRACSSKALALPQQ